MTDLAMHYAIHHKNTALLHVCKLTNVYFNQNCDQIFKNSLIHTEYPYLYYAVYESLALYIDDI